MLNHYSSASIDALLSKVPIISLEKILNKRYKFKDLDNFSIHLAFKPKDVKKLEYILKSKFFLKKYELNCRKKFEKIFLFSSN